MRQHSYENVLAIVSFITVRTSNRYLAAFGCTCSTEQYSRFVMSDCWIILISTDDTKKAEAESTPVHPAAIVRGELPG